MRQLCIGLSALIISSLAALFLEPLPSVASQASQTISCQRHGSILAVRSLPVRAQWSLLVVHGTDYSEAYPIAPGSKGGYQAEDILTNSAISDQPQCVLQVLGDSRRLSLSGGKCADAVNLSAVDNGPVLSVIAIARRDKTVYIRARLDQATLFDAGVTSVDTWLVVFADSGQRIGVPATGLEPVYQAIEVNPSVPGRPILIGTSNEGADALQAAVCI